MSSAVTVRATARVECVRRSVRIEAQAMAVVQPRHKKRASRIFPFSTQTESSRMSPQTGFEVCASAVAFANLPALRGLLKCSNTRSLYMPLS